MTDGKHCSVCGAEISRDEIGLTLKLLGTSHPERYCKKCMAVKMKCSVEKLDELIEYFRASKCTLFG